MSEWIAFKDRRPEPNKRVLLGHHSKPTLLPLCMIGCAEEGLEAPYTHWQPAPEPPPKPDPFDEFFDSLPLWEGVGGDLMLRRLADRCVLKSDVRAAFNAGLEAGRKEK